jgi:Tetracyclin repressor-like, C-terminal domain
MVERAIARGDVPAETDVGLVVEGVIAPIYFRLLMSGEKLDTGFVETVAELVAAGASGGPGSAG